MSDNPDTSMFNYLVGLHSAFISYDKEYTAIYRWTPLGVESYLYGNQDLAEKDYQAMTKDRDKANFVCIGRAFFTRGKELPSAITHKFEVIDGKRS